MIRIRLAREADVPSILAIYRYYVENTAITFEYDVPTLAEYQERFRSITMQYPWLVAEDAGKVVGFSYAAPAFERMAYQWNVDISVYIHTEYHRRGIARAFYEAMDELLSLQGYYTIYALITGSNEKSLAFHTALGYRQVGILPNTGYKFGEWHDVYWLEKELKPRVGTPQKPKRTCEIPMEAMEESFSRAERKIR